MKSGLSELFKRFGRHYAVGEVICAEGDPGTEVYFMIEGLVRVTISPHLDDNQTNAKELCRLGPGDVFGELALLDQNPRSATVTAVEDSAAIVFEKDDLYRHIGLYPDLAVRLLQLLAQRMRRMDRELKVLLEHREYLNLLEESQREQSENSELKRN